MIWPAYMIPGSFNSKVTMTAPLISAFAETSFIWTLSVFSGTWGVTACRLMVIL
jgi:hypothetical protein